MALADYDAFLAGIASTRIARRCLSDGTADDLSGNARHLTAVGAPTFHASGDGGGVTLNGTSQYLAGAFGHAATSLLGSEEVWGTEIVMETTQAVLARLFGIKQTISTKYEGLHLSLNIDAANVVNPGYLSMRSQRDSTTKRLQYDADSGFQDGAMHVIGAVLTQERGMVLYLDGRRMYTSHEDPHLIAAAWSSITNAIYYGAWNNEGTADSFFQGRIYRITEFVDEIDLFGGSFSHRARLLGTAAAWPATPAPITFTRQNGGLAVITRADTSVTETGEFVIGAVKRAPAIAAMHGAAYFALYTSDHSEGSGQIGYATFNNLDLSDWTDRGLLAITPPEGSQKEFPDYVEIPGHPSGRVYGIHYSVNTSPQKSILTTTSDFVTWTDEGVTLDGDADPYATHLGYQREIEHDEDAGTYNWAGLYHSGSIDALNYVSSGGYAAPAPVGMLHTSEAEQFGERFGVACAAVFRVNGTRYMLATSRENTASGGTGEQLRKIGLWAYPTDTELAAPMWEILEPIAGDETGDRGFTAVFVADGEGEDGNVHLYHGHANADYTDTNVFHATAPLSAAPVLASRAVFLRLPSGAYEQVGSPIVAA